MTAIDNDGIRQEGAERILANIKGPSMSSSRMDRLYRQNQFDNAPIVGLLESVSSIRPVYANFTDHEFAAWYTKRYKPSGGVGAVMAALEHLKHK